jgi:tetratricopeptide (TPR) repeat protein
MPALSSALAATRHTLFGSMNGRLSVSNAIPPYDATAVRLLASSAARRGQLTKAGRLLWNLLAANPRDRKLQLALASVMIHGGQPMQALALLEQSLAERPDDAQIFERRAFILAQLGHAEDALELYSKLVSAHPDVPALLLARGQVLITLGNEQAAVDDYRRAIGCDPSYGDAWWALANIKTRTLSSDDIRRMTSLLARGDVSRTSRINLEFALGKAFEDAGVPDHSFEHYARGNDLQSRGAFNIRDATRNHVNQVIGSFCAADLATRTGHSSEAPIFIVGMPRSGTTLVEQILASHPDVEGTSELPNISAIARSLGEGIGRTEFDYSDLLAGYSSDALCTLGERYLVQSTAYRRTDRPFFVDKMPSNWMHVALIRLILPNARIIDVRRDPLDCCFSNYAQYYPRGHEFTNSLEGLGAHYRDYERLMAHFDAVAPGKVIRIGYEQLVERPEETIRGLLARLDLPFAPSCLRFFENGRAVRTPSAQQVRQPINRRGIGRWRPYEPWLGPLIDALRPA